MIDHLIVATPTLEATVADLGALLGVVLAPGGRHLGLGTRNYLAGLGDGCYLEVIGVDGEQPEPEQPRPFGIDDLPRARLQAWAAQVTDIESAARVARERGYDVGPVRSATRERTDGTRLSWRMTSIRSGVVPFLIDWTGCPHPSAAAPTGLRLEHLHGWHPEPAPRQAELAALGLDMPIAFGPEERLEATIVGPTGELRLS